MTLLKVARTKNTPAETAIALMASMGLRTWDDHHRHFHPPKKRLKLRSPFVREVRE